MTQSAENDALRDALAPYLYEAYRLGKYGEQRYLPMWHEKPASEHDVPWPEVDGAVTAVLAVLATGPIPPAFVHIHDYLDGDGFTYCQECFEATGDYEPIADCPDRQPASVTPPGQGNVDE